MGLLIKETGLAAFISLFIIIINMFGINFNIINIFDSYPVPYQFLLQKVLVLSS